MQLYLAYIYILCYKICRPNNHYIGNYKNKITMMIIIKYIFIFNLFTYVQIYSIKNITKHAYVVTEFCSKNVVYNNYILKKKLGSILTKINNIKF